MNREDRGILIGMVLGDGCLNVRYRANGKYGYWKSEMRIVHSLKQLEYLKHKCELLRRIFGGKHKVSIYDHTIPKIGKVYSMCGFSKSNKYFKSLKKMTHRDGKKYFSRQVLDMLTPQGIALWYMDDGNAGRNRNKQGKITSIYSCLSTYCTEEEAHNICEVFKDKFGIEFRIGYEKSKHAHIVRANTKESKLFAELIKPYIIPSMQYKLSHVLDLDEHERQTPPKEPFRCLDCGSKETKGSAKGRCSSCYKKWRRKDPTIRPHILHLQRQSYRRRVLAGAMI